MFRVCRAAWVIPHAIPGSTESLHGWITASRHCCPPGSLPLGFLSQLNSDGREVVAVVEVLEKAGLSRFPTEGLAGDNVGRREIQRDQIREESKVSGQHQYVYGNAHGRQAQTAANGLGDRAERDALALNPVPTFASRALLQREAEQGGEVAAVHGRPPVRAVSGVADGALLLRELD